MLLQFREKCGWFNFDEWRYLSNPRATHSDGDGVADGIEIGQGSDPGDTADNGQAPPPEEKLVMKITVGDPSDSHSERWRVEAVDVETGKTVLRHASRQYGQLSAEAESVFDRFKPGRAYAFRLRHAGTDPDKLDADPEGEDLPDYDWSLVISYQNEQGEYISLASPAQSEYLVIDPYDNDTNALSPDTPFLLAPAYPFATIGAGRDARPAYREKILPMSVVMLPLAITSDANRDGVIDFADRKQVTPEKPWRFWTNDDDDSGATGGTDIPQDPASKGTNGYDHKVNGVRDLVDFFPLDLNLTAALKICPQRKYSYKITHDAPQTPPCFKIVQARDLEAADSGAYLEDLDTALATDGLESAPIHSHGRNLDSRFLDAQEDGNGLLLVEAIRPTTDPIRLRIIRNSDQQVMVETAFHVSVTPALDMIRWKFVSPGAADITAAQIPGDPANWPDEDRNGKHFVWVHGYNVNPDQSKGWGTEAFKRMFWSGSNARFTAFAWYGYQSQTPFDIQGGPKTPNYQVNLLHAFGTAKSFKQFLDLLEGEKTVAAHSMGNIVVGSAMHDWGVRPKNYIMLNSAAAKECYDGTEADNADQDTRMVYPAWAAYDKELRASEWHKLAWPENDKRRTLTWRNRLRGVIDNGGLTDVYNFYSSGEEVLNNPETNNPSIDPTNPFGISGLLWTTGNKTWAIQEKRKGYGLTGVVHTSNYGGWLPNLLPYHVDLHVTASGPWGTHRMRTQAELPPATDAAWLAKLKTRPFFNTSNHPELYDAQTGAGSTGSDYAQQHRNTLIAEMIPCTTFAAGRNGFLSTITGLPTNRQIDMNTAMKTDPMRWPLSNANENDAPPNNPDSRPWVHSDIREKAFVHNRNAYEKFVVIGNLNQTE